METTKEIKTETPKETTMITKGGKPLVEVNIKRDDDGVKLYIKSHREFKILRGEGAEVILGNVRCFRPKSETLYGIKGFFVISNEPYKQFMYESYPNLCVLLAKDLKNGVTFNFGNFPVSEEMIEGWLSKFRDQVKSIYLTYCREISYSLNITTSIVENSTYE